MRPSVISEPDEQISRCNRPGRKRFTKNRLCFLLFPSLTILMAILFLAVNMYRTPDFNELLTWARLAKLPKSIKNLKVDTRTAMDNGRAVPNTGELFIRFQAEPNDIDNFINNSPGIDKNRFRPLNTAVNSNPNPPWWVINRSASGRIYIIPEDKDILGGTVTIDDDSRTVLIYMYFTANPQIRDALFFLENLKDNSEEFVEDLIHEVSDVLGN